MQRPLPHNQQHLLETDFHVSGGFRTRNPSKRVAADPRIRPRGYCGHSVLFSKDIIYLIFVLLRINWTEERDKCLRRNEDGVSIVKCYITEVEKLGVLICCWPCILVIINFRFQLNAQYLISITMLLYMFRAICAHLQEDLCIFTTSGSMSFSFGDRAVGRFQLHGHQKRLT